MKRAGTLLLIILTWLAVATATAQESTGYTVYVPLIAGGGGDAHEPDNEPDRASELPLFATQCRSLPAGDVDWVTFALDGYHYAIVETWGRDGDDTYIVVYDAALNVVAESDDGGHGDYARVNLYGFPTGVYYAEITSPAPVRAYWLNFRHYDDYLTPPPDL